MTCKGLTAKEPARKKNGVSKIFKQIVEHNGKLRSQSMLPISLSYDHRVINGADAAKFTKLFGEIINKTSLLK